MTKRLIEEWLPIAELGEESMRERRSMTALPAVNYLHVWWARRPLVASRAAILASLLPSDADHKRFLHALGIHGDPVAAKKRIDKAKKSGENLGLNPYGYPRAFQYKPSKEDEAWLADEARKLGINQPAVLDPTAGGGSIPFESLRLGCKTLANDLNPVAVIVQKATYEWPAKHGQALLEEFNLLTDRFLCLALPKYRDLYPVEGDDKQVLGYVWARTIRCPYCAGKIPLSPNWKLAPDGTGIKLVPNLGSGLGDDSRHCSFEIVKSAREQSDGTAKGGSATCPFPDCARIINGDQIKQFAQSDGMGEQLFAVVYKQRLPLEFTKSGKPKKHKWKQCYRAACLEDDNAKLVEERLAEKLPEWDALNLIPDEQFPAVSNDDRPIQYGMPMWRDLFSSRQLMAHGISMEVFSEMLREEVERQSQLSELKKAAFGYLAIAIDRLIDWSSRQSTWEQDKQRMAHTFSVHAFPVRWSFAEMPLLVAGGGYEWTFRQTSKCLGELIDLIGSGKGYLQKSGPLFASLEVGSPPEIAEQLIVTCGPGDSLTHLQSGSVDVIVMDPPYYDKVMYAELGDFFYVWLKRTAGMILPELFFAPLTDKESEAVASPALHSGKKGARALAGIDYQTKMAEIFSECRRVLKDDGIMRVMFTHKATGAWDALAKGLIDANFSITASWPINTEAESSLHIKDKASASSTIFLVCRPRPAKQENDEIRYWEDLEPRVKAAVRRKVDQFQAGGIRGVDLYLSCFGPALEEFSLHWPIKRGQPKSFEEKVKKRGRAQLTLEELLGQDDPYAVSPEDALDAARREVKAWRMEKLTSGSRRTQLDPLTEWFVLAWDAFQAPQFPYDEALRLARVVGLDLDKDVVGVLAEKKASDLILWDSSTRATKGKLGSPDGTRSWIDAIHHCAHRARSIDLKSAKQLLDDNGLGNSPEFLMALQAVLEVLPISCRYSGYDPVKNAIPSASDFEALEDLRRLDLKDKVPEPKQLQFDLPETTASPSPSAMVEQP